MKKFKLIYPLILMGTLFLLTNNCKKDANSSQVPVLTTTAITNITQTTATSGGNITNANNAAIVARGVCWSTSPNPTIANSKTSDATGPGNYISNLTGLTAGTTYYLRAYATNSYGTGYGNSVTFTTSGGSAGTVTDIDGNVYQTVVIGTQVWMLENLKTTKYRNGNSIPNFTDVNAWDTTTMGAYCNYNNDVSNVAIYGRLYNWYAASDSRNIAPTGWHVSTSTDWTTLINFLGGSGYAMIALQDTGSVYWLPGDNDGASNSSGFTALPAGERVNGSFVNLQGNAFWWCSDHGTGSNLEGWFLSFYATEIDGYANNQINSGYSIRCVKN